MSHSSPRSPRRRAVALGAAAALVAGLAVPFAAAPAGAADGGLPGSELFLNPWSTTLEAAQSLHGQARADAQLLGSIPSADWFTDGTPAEVEAAVDDVVSAAAAKGQMPVLVAYYLPFRDCAQYSAGGALDTAGYQAWIDGFAAGIGDRPATVILEPDGLGIIPHYTTLDGMLEWCRPAEVSAETAAADRYTQLNYAVDTLGGLASTSVYLDGTGSSWLNVGEISDRLIKGGVQRADGFFLNASNYQFTTNSTYFGRWISSCIAYVTEVNPGDFGSCGNQYWNGGPATEWNGATMSPYGEWGPGNADLTLNVDGVESRYDLILGGVEPTTRFVVDTSRNGLGPWDYPDGVYPEHEDWCNPPDRGLGLRPTTETGVALVDAYLWIKVPGESDGKCYRGTGGPLDPERGMEDPAAGQWFVEQARELIALANPPIAPLDCHVKVVGTKIGKGFIAALTVRNNGTSTLDPWTLTWSFDGTQKVVRVVGGDAEQDGANVAVEGARSLRPGKTAALAVTGTGPAVEPWQFHLNGKACTS
ncbi:glycoside hydrolase family 6 protein [Microbacterium gallinarum]|uniref:Glucanase n=1 Tax=Microbacterium gallinarum TaxID=2762209 RepID=A0ABR8X0N1_9MICO|nr:glycoside hydrolase family 6 protein [Microbacterium gallinarum]MBD8022692.1 glycoside hydrolase family 6 protein [Microbacterium gallinarum]